MSSKKREPLSLLPLIYKKREGGSLSKDEIFSWVNALTTPAAPPTYQTSALLAFIFLRGLSAPETAFLVEAMKNSGKPFRYAGFPKDALFVDKHSTGGVGDKVTLALAPWAVASEPRLHFPTIAGRGLGHTGGTVDKLESIPGFSCGLTLNKFYRLLKKERAAFLSQTKQIAPADGVLYALRDVTGTVESIPLITASILSKKLSENLDYLLLDVKFGSGAFMHKWEDAEALAFSLVQTCERAGVKAAAFLTSMESPLGRFSGNAWEVKEVIDLLKGQTSDALRTLTEEFLYDLLQRFRISADEARTRVSESLSSGKAFEAFERIVSAQGGSLKKFEAGLSKAKLIRRPIKATRSGTLQWNVRELGLALVDLGAGRKRASDRINPWVGLEHIIHSGNPVRAGDEVLVVLASSKSTAQSAEERILKNALKISSEPATSSPLIRKVLKTS